MAFFDSFIKGAGWTVAPGWRLLGATLALGLLALTVSNSMVFNALFRLDAGLIDRWQRLSGTDEPSGEVVVVGIDSAAFRQAGRWPWPRATLTEVVEKIVAAGPRSLTLDVLLTEPGPYAQSNLMRMFRKNGPEAISMLGRNPDADLAVAIASAPVALAVAGGSARAIDDLPQLTQCADPALIDAADARDYYIECLLFPLSDFEAAASGYAVAFSSQDLDGVVRRARAFVAQPYIDANGARQEVFLPAMPVAALTVCAGADADCYAYDTSFAFLADPDAGGWNGYQMHLLREAGAPAPTPLTPALDFWLDFGALPALSPAASGAEPGDAAMISAASVLLDDTAEIARLTDKHVILGLTRIGSIDQHTTPLALGSGAPGVLIQALAADNLASGRALAQPGWSRLVTQIFLVIVAVIALLRLGMSNATAMTGAALAIIAAPIAASWAAFEFGQMVFYGATPAIGAFVGLAPIVYGRIAAVRRDLAEAREATARDEERMDAARSIQLGSLPFAADYTDIGFETASICRPAQEVGGDFFELFQLSDGRLYAAVGDVSGKGLEASLVTALSKSIAGAVTDRVAGPLGDALTQVSREFVRQAPHEWRKEKGGFVTLVAARIDPATGEAEFACAGCEPPTLVGADGSLKPVELPSVAPLGWIEDATFETAKATLAPGDTVVMFTDGVTEAETPSGELFGQEQADQLAATVNTGARDMLAVLEGAVLAHQAGGAPTDDTTILAVTWRGAPGEGGSGEVG